MTLLALLALALIDSINPSAIVVTLYLLSDPGLSAPGKVLTYIGAVFVTYLALGAAMLFGIDVLLPSAGEMMETRVGLIVQTLVGLAMLIYSLRAPKDAGPRRPVALPGAGTIAALLVLGVTVTVMELPTAIPYFAAIALITEAKLSVASWAPVLVGYNLIFILPPMALLVGHVVLGRRLRERYDAFKEKLERGARETMLWILGLVGGGLCVTGILDLVVRFR